MLGIFERWRLGTVLMVGMFIGWPAFADTLPACALTGSMTMTIGGKPALRLSDVANCPPDLYEVITSVSIDGQPMVHFKTGMTGKVRCVTLAAPSVSVEGKPASTLGMVACNNQ